jgi:hypothetical protein
MTKPDAAHRLRPGRRVARQLVSVLLLTSAVSLTPVPSSTSQTSLDAFAAERAGLSTASVGRMLRQRVRGLERRVTRLEAKVEIMERIARRYKKWKRCILWVPVSEYGDPDHTFGYRYTERDGTGLDHRPALARDPNRRWPDYIFLNFAKRDRCQSAPTVPGTPEKPGTADPAFAAATAASAPTLRARVRRLERKVEDLEQRAARLLDMSEEFDEWESCLSWVPATEYGDPARRYGYLFDTADGPSYMPALAVDVSEWDDPDYMVLAFAGRDRPFRERECEGEPGESVD